MSSNPPSDLSLSQQALQLLKQNNSGTLCTFSVKHADFPFASVANYSVSPNGEPIFFFSSMATHSKNLRANPRAALLVTQDDAGDSAGNLALGRVTLIGTVKPVEAEELDAISDDYIRANPDAAQWASFGDFQFYRLEMVDIYFVAGFGAMGWVSPDEFSSAHE